MCNILIVMHFLYFVNVYRYAQYLVVYIYSLIFWCTNMFVHVVMYIYSNIVLCVLFFDCRYMAEILSIRCKTPKQSILSVRNYSAIIGNFWIVSIWILSLFLTNENCPSFQRASLNHITENAGIARYTSEDYNWHI